eukprot:COSAG02_NODE_5328_length_4432_cov_22.448188_1_plen_1298_part_10
MQSDNPVAQRIDVMLDGIRHAQGVRTPERSGRDLLSQPVAPSPRPDPPSAMDLVPEHLEPHARTTRDAAEEVRRQLDLSGRGLSIADIVAVACQELDISTPPDMKLKARLAEVCDALDIWTGWDSASARQQPASPSPRTPVVDRDDSAGSSSFGSAEQCLGNMLATGWEPVLVPPTLLENGTVSLEVAGDLRKASVAAVTFSACNQQLQHLEDWIVAMAYKLQVEVPPDIQRRSEPRSSLLATASVHDLTPLRSLPSSGSARGKLDRALGRAVKLPDPPVPESDKVASAMFTQDSVELSSWTTVRMDGSIEKLPEIDERKGMHVARTSVPKRWFDACDEILGVENAGNRGDPLSLSVDVDELDRRGSEEREGRGGPDCVAFVLFDTRLSRECKKLSGVNKPFAATVARSKTNLPRFIVPGEGGKNRLGKHTTAVLYGTGGDTEDISSDSSRSSPWLGGSESPQRIAGSPRGSPTHSPRHSPRRSGARSDQHAQNFGGSAHRSPSRSSPWLGGSESPQRIAGSPRGSPTRSLRHSPRHSPRRSGARSDQHAQNFGGSAHRSPSRSPPSPSQVRRPWSSLARHTESGSPVRSPSVDEGDSEQPRIVGVVGHSGTILPVNQFRGGDRVGGGFHYTSPPDVKSLLARLRAAEIEMTVKTSSGLNQLAVLRDELALVPVFGPENHSAAVLCVVPLPSMQQRLHKIAMLLQRKGELERIAAIRHDVWRYLLSGRYEMVKLEWEGAIKTFEVGLAKRHDGDLTWSIWSKLEHDRAEATKKKAQRDNGRLQGQQCLERAATMAIQCQWETALAEIRRGQQMRTKDAGHVVWSGLESSMESYLASQVKRNSARERACRCLQDAEKSGQTCDWERCIDVAQRPKRCSDLDADGSGVWADLEALIKRASESQRRRDASRVGAAKHLQEGTAFAEKGEWQTAIETFAEGLKLRTEDEAGEEVWVHLQCRLLHAQCAASHLEKQWKPDLQPYSARVGKFTLKRPTKPEVSDPPEFGEPDLQTYSVRVGKFTLKRPTRPEVSGPPEFGEPDLQTYSARVGDFGRPKPEVPDLGPKPNEFLEEKPKFEERKPTEAELRANAAGGEDGKLRCILSWDNPDDLDLHCVLPSSKKIYYKHPNEETGSLDVDQNAKKNSISEHPVENIRFTDPEKGRYVFKVNNFKKRTSTSTPYTVQLNQLGREPQIIKQQDIAEGDTQVVFEIEYDPDEPDALVWTDSRVRRENGKHKGAFDAKLKAWRDKRKDTEAKLKEWESRERARDAAIQDQEKWQRCEQAFKSHKATELTALERIRQAEA